jgi:hypothetical protein
MGAQRVDMHDERPDDLQQILFESLYFSTQFHVTKIQVDL